MGATSNTATPAATGASSTSSALPIALSVDGPYAPEVRGWVEGVLGWQPIDGATAGLVPPALEICDIDRRHPELPCLLLVGDEVPGPVAAAAVMRVHPDATLAWPSGREELPSVAAGVASEPPADTRVTRTMRIGGAAGGVGTSTVSLALAGCGAWSGLTTLAVVRGTTPQVRTVPTDALAAVDLYSRADRLPGIDRLRAVRAEGVVSAPPLADPRIDLAVLDMGVDADVDVLVCRPDAAAMDAVTDTTAAVVIVVGDGPVRAAQLRRRAGGRRTVHIAWSARVARAGVVGRVPGSLPGRFIRELAPLIAPLAGPDDRRRR